MDKVKKFLEGYVEWIALTLGAAFLMWMVYLYVVQQPVTVAVGPNPAVTPGSIDQKIWEGPGETLENQIQKGQVVRLTVPDFSQQVAASFNTPTPPLLPLYNSDHMPPAEGAVAITPIPGGTNDAAKVTALPKAPPIVKLAIAAGHSNITPPVNANAPAAPGLPGAVAPVAAQAIDKSWVSVMGTLPSLTGLNPAFTAANIPTNPLIHKTTVLRVILVRQERDASGNWGPEVEVQPPSIDALPLPLPPQVAANRQALMAEQSYQGFAEQNPLLILRPAFYTVVQGDKWYTPGTPNPNESAVELVDDKFDAAHFTGDLDTLDDADRKAVMDARRQAAQAAAAAARQQQQAAAAAARQQQQAAQRSSGRSGGGRSGGGRSGGGGGGDSGFLVADPGRASSASGLADDEEQRNPPAPQPTLPDATDAGAAAAGPVAPAGGDLPKGAFDPATQPDFAVWAHDDTVVPGKTYRYKLRYVISNPVFATQQLCKPQNLALQFSITSADSEWTEPVNVESDTNFYAANASHGGIQFDIFKWHDGKWKKQSMVANPGDVIGTESPTTGDPNFATGWTLVDVREIPNEPTNRIILLASDNGTLQRELKIDARTKKYRNLKDLAAKAAGAGPGQPLGPGDAGPGQVPGAPGMPPGGPGV